jgi:hypothetical protein
MSSSITFFFISVCLQLILFFFVNSQPKNLTLGVATFFHTKEIKALFGWAFGCGFCPQKPKAQPKGPKVTAALD